MIRETKSQRALTLALLMPNSFADHTQTILPSDDLAITANFLN